MSFDIQQLDNSEHEEEAFEAYQDALLELFANSPEGQARLEIDPALGFWAAQLMYYGYNYLGVTPPKMTVRHVDEIVTDLFPRKISLSSPDEADDTIPELLAFWQYLKREHRQPNADAVLKLLREIEPDFKRMMNDPSKFGMAKSLFMMAQSMGFDMTDEEQANQFIALYNARLMAGDPELLSALPDVGPSLSTPDSSRPTATRKSRTKRKRARKRAKAARKRSRKR